MKWQHIALKRHKQTFGKIFNGQDLNQLIATAYDNAGNKEKALQFLQKTRLYKLAQELGQKNSQELVITPV